METIDCLLVGASIAPTLCEAEQDPIECAGCRARTRRCTACGKARGIADPAQGLCATCARRLGSDAPTAPRERVQHSIEDVAAVTRRIAALPIVPDASDPQIRRTVRPVAPLPPAILEDTTQLLALLTEHAEERGENRIIRNPDAVLRVRAKLSTAEAGEALRSLAKQQRITLDPANARLFIGRVTLSTPHPPEPRASPPPAAPLAPERGIAAPASTPPSATASPKRRTPERVSARRDRRTPQRSARHEEQTPRTTGRTAPEILGALADNAATIDGARLVRGAVSMLQLRCSIGPQDVIQHLEDLERSGRIRKRDGWRVIEILAPAVPEATPPPTTARDSETARIPLVPLEGETTIETEPLTFAALAERVQERIAALERAVDASIPNAAGVAKEIRRLRAQATDGLQNLTLVEHHLQALADARQFFARLGDAPTDAPADQSPDPDPLRSAE